MKEPKFMDMKELLNPDITWKEHIEVQTERQVLMALILGSEALAKACFDPFDYALKMRTGEVINFHCAHFLNKEWIKLELSDHNSSDIPYPCRRGINVRIADIVWVVDGPEERK